MNDDFAAQLTQWLYQACLAEVLSPKPGNVAPGTEYQDATVEDFVTSGRVSAPLLANAESAGVGKAVFAAAEATQAAVGHNTNLGILLLLGPLAAVPRSFSLADGLGTVLSELTIEDADWAYRAIRLASPGGLGDADTQDVHEAPTESLQDCMRHAAHRDLIAAQYVNNFADVLGVGCSLLMDSRELVAESDRITWVALKLMAQYGDSLIARKCGQEASDDVRNRASAVLETGWPATTAGQQAYRQFDEYLRSDGNRLNPGTTADMIAAIVFAALRSGQYTPDASLSEQIESRKSQ